MLVYRLTRAKYADSLSGIGAAKAGGRWNSKGTEIIYTAENRSLAMAEVVVHLDLNKVPVDFCMMTVFVPDQSTIKTLNEGNLPVQWNQFPPTRATQDIGDNFVYSRDALLLKVPSVVTKGDFNILINPSHPDFGRVSISDISSFRFDRRLF